MKCLLLGILAEDSRLYLDVGAGKLSSVHHTRSTQALNIAGLARRLEASMILNVFPTLTRQIVQYFLSVTQWNDLRREVRTHLDRFGLLLVSEGGWLRGHLHIIVLEAILSTLLQIEP